jgi:YVTN family beta-propeller protein
MSTMLTQKRTMHQIMIAATAIIVVSTSPFVARVRAQPQATNTACNQRFASPLFVSMPATVGGVLIDDACEFLYITNTTQNRVEVFSLQTLTRHAPIQVGSQPVGLDVTPDGKLLYVANSGASNISVVDLVQRAEVRRISVPMGFAADRPYSLAVANNGLVLFSTTFAGSGFGARMMQLDGATDEVRQRTDFWFSGSTTERTHLSASGDRSAIGIVAGDISSGPVFRYSAATNTFSPEKALQSFVSDVGLDMSGSTFVVTPGAYVLDAALNLVGTIPLDPGWGGTAVDPAGTIGYRSFSSRIDVLDLFTLLKTGELMLGDSVDSAYFTNFVGHMDISMDGRLLAVITDHGVSLMRTSALDTTPPTLAIPAEIAVAATTPAGAIVSFVATAIDDMDAAPTVGCTPPSGSLFAIGTTVVTCIATDAAGNATSATFSVRVSGAADLIEDLLNRVVTDGWGPGQSFANKLRAILIVLRNGGPARDACGPLGAVINEAHAQSGKNLSPQTAIEIINTAATTRALLGCGNWR